MGNSISACCKSDNNRVQSCGQLIIYGDYFNTDTRIALAALDYCGDTNYRFDIVNSLKKEEVNSTSYKSINPTGGIPTAVEGNFTVIGSTEMKVLMYLAETHHLVKTKLYQPE